MGWVGGVGAEPRNMTVAPVPAQWPCMESGHACLMATVNILLHTIRFFPMEEWSQLRLQCKTGATRAWKSSHT